MKNKTTSLIYLSMLAGLIFCNGCTSTPFAPIAVPKATSMRPEPKKVKKQEDVARLKRLHHARTPEYVIMPGDVFAFVIPDREDLSRPSIQVMSDGAISISPIGYVKIAGFTIPEASKILSQKYQKYVRNCEIVLEPVKIQPATITVVGAVGKPGIYPIIVGDTKISDAITIAGGVLSITKDDSEPLQLSDLESAYIMRNGEILPVNFSKVLTEGNWLHNIPVMNKDYIYVPSLENARVTVLGEVGNPSSVVFQPNLTVLQALGKVGGLKDTKSADIKIIRGGLRNPVVYNLNIKDMQLGRISDFPLKPSDIVFVPKKPISEWNVIVRDLMVSIQMLNTLAGPFGSPSQFYDDND
ncbi:MAG: SLBB domain-containing protein [Lentisphaeria bacterium]|nr:SLBB domain-containing protein [Lentisphaeria bacterium]